MPEIAEVEPVRLQRSRGKINLSFKQRDGLSVVDGLYQSGCSKVKIARAEQGRLAEAVLINTAGGMTDGDRIDTHIEWQDATTAIVTSQAAERIYQARSGHAAITTRLNVADGACAIWLPQETIMFDGGRISRSNEIDLSANARFIGVEAMLFGRSAMGELVKSGWFRDSWHIRIDGRLEFVDVFELDGDIDRQMKRSAMGQRPLPQSSTWWVTITSIAMKSAR